MTIVVGLFVTVEGWVIVVKGFFLGSFLVCHGGAKIFCGFTRFKATVVGFLWLMKGGSWWKMNFC